MSFEFISVSGDSDSDSDSDYDPPNYDPLVTFLPDTGSGIKDEKVKQYAKILACVAVLYGDIEDNIRDVWALELNKLLKKVEDDAAQEKDNAALAALDPKNKKRKKVIQPKVQPNLQRNDVFAKAQVGGITFRNSAGYLLQNIEKILKPIQKYGKFDILNYALSIVNINQWGNKIERFIRIQIPSPGRFPGDITGF